MEITGALGLRSLVYSCNFQIRPFLTTKHFSGNIQPEPNPVVIWAAQFSNDIQLGQYVVPVFEILEPWKITYLNVQMCELIYPFLFITSDMSNNGEK